MFNHQYLLSTYFPPVWFAPGDESHLLPEEKKPEVEWLGGGGDVYHRKTDKERDKSVYRIFNKSQSDDEKERERIELGIIEETKPLINEKVKVVSRKQNAKPESNDYWSLHLYENLLNERIAEITTDILLQNIRDNAINALRQKAIKEALFKRQLEIEKALFIEYQRIIEEDMIFVFSMLAEM